jgi:hypothetical protein
MESIRKYPVNIRSITVEIPETQEIPDQFKTDLEGNVWVVRHDPEVDDYIHFRQSDNYYPEVSFKDWSWEEYEDPDGYDCYFKPYWIVEDSCPFCDGQLKAEVVDPPGIQEKGEFVVFAYCYPCNSISEEEAKKDFRGKNVYFPPMQINIEIDEYGQESTMVPYGDMYVRFQ